MKALAELGLELNESIPLEILLSENFNGSLYGMTQEQTDKVRALKDVVSEYNRAKTLDKNVQITDSQKAANLVYGILKDLDHEEAWIAYLTTGNTVISVEMLFKGALDSVVISPRVILAKALSLNAANIILFLDILSRLKSGRISGTNVPCEGGPSSYGCSQMRQCPASGYCWRR